jgi:FkbM family methyltransferase
MKTSKLIDAIGYRVFWMRYGVRFLRSSGFQIRRLKIAGHPVTLSFPDGEEQVMNYEFKNILYDDCYGLRQIEGKVETILDVGSNLGFFSLAARSRFPDAKIHGYEPNPAIQSHLLNNTGGLSIKVHPEAIGARDGMIELKMDGGSLLGKAVASESGNIKKTAMAAAIERIGGKVDLLKLDCEGGEWEVFEERSVWTNIGRLTMEYHLWANPAMDVPGMVKTIRDLGFRITHLSEAPELKWGMLHAVKV